MRSTLFYFLATHTAVDARVEAEERMNGQQPGKHIVAVSQGSKKRHRHGDLQGISGNQKSVNRKTVGTCICLIPLSHTSVSDSSAEECRKDPPRLTAPLLWTLMRQAPPTPLWSESEEELERKKKKSGEDLDFQSCSIVANDPPHHHPQPQPQPRP